MQPLDKNSPERLSLRLLKALAILAPWVLSMYLLYWLEHSNIWSLYTPHRGKTSVLILVLGMGFSLLVFSRLYRRSSR